MNIALWLPVLAVLFGASAHALSTDGGGSVLARLGVTDWALPKSAVAPMVLVFGLAAAVFEGVHNGLSWQDSAARGVLASISALFGVIGSQHMTGRDGDGRPLSVLLLAGVLSLALSACGHPLVKPLVYLLADTAKCVVSHPDLPDAENFKLCGVGKEQEPAATELLGQARAVSAKAAADASARAGAARCVATP